MPDLSAPKAKESEILKSILEYLKIRGYLCWRNNSGAYVDGDNRGKKRFIRYGLPGSGDIIGCLKDGRFFSIECKRPGLPPTPLQRDFMFKVQTSNGIAFVASSIDDLIERGF